MFREHIKFYYTFNVIQILELAFGLTGNLIALIICLRKNLRMHPFFILTAYGCLADSINIMNWASQSVAKMLFDYELIFESLAGCKIIFFLDFFSSQWSSWILVST